MQLLDREISYGDRDPKTLALTQAEADAMIADGFRFAVYDKHTPNFQLEPTFEFRRDDARGGLAHTPGHS